MSVTVNALTKRYGRQVAVDGVSFQVNPGDVVGFLGPNGAGKTTTMRIICGYLAPTAGTVTVCGHDVIQDSRQARRCIGYLPENNPLYGDLYVKEFLQYVAALHPVPQARRRVTQIIDMVGLGPEQHKKINNLSKGYRQRVGLAQALLHDPPVLIMDEPTVGLDPLQLQEIRQLIRNIGKEKTVILSTHIMQEVKLLCNRVLVIHRGKLMADGTLQELLSRDAGIIRLQVTFARPVAVEALRSVAGVLQVQQNDECTFLLQSAFPNQQQLFQFAQNQDNVIRSLTEMNSDLEEVFRHLTTGARTS